MAERIPQSVAYLLIFKAYLSSDHVTEATGKTIAITISKNGGAFGNPNAGATNATEISSGWYKVTLDTTDTGTLGPLAVRGAVATIDDVGVALTVAVAPASQTSVDDLPTNAELATALGTADDAVLTAIDALPTNAELATALGTADDAVLSALSAIDGKIDTIDTNVDAILVDTNELQTDWVNGGRLDLILDARASQTSVDDLPTNAELATALGTADDAVLAQVALVKAKTDNLPTDPADQSLIITATDALATLIGDVPTNAELSTALGTADDAVLAQVALVKAVTDKLDETLVDTTSGYQFNANALELAPTGGAAPSAAAIRAEIDSNSTQLAAIVADTNELQSDWVNGGRLDNILDARSSQTSVDDLPTNAELATAIAGGDDAVLAQVALVKAKTDNLPSDPADQSLIIAATDALATLIGDVPTNAELATALGTADDAVLAAISALNNLSAAGVRTAVGLATANLDTQLDALPTNAELAAALGGADDAALAAIAGLNNISVADVWANATRTLSAGTNIVLAKGTGVTGFNDLSAAQVNAEADTALADYDGPTHTELTAEFATADDAVLAQVATANSNILLVKAKTDPLTFTVAGQVDSNIQSVNDVAVTGDGSVATPWGP